MASERAPTWRRSEHAIRLNMSVMARRASRTHGPSSPMVVTVIDSRPAQLVARPVVASPRRPARAPLDSAEGGGFGVIPL